MRYRRIVNLMPESEYSERLSRKLTLLDAAMVVVGGTIGASIFITPADVLRAVPDPRFAMLLWIIAGGVTLMAGLATAELSAMFPEAGGQYVFIREAYGKLTAFLYGWMLFTAGNSGALAAMAIACATFCARALPALSADHVIFAQSIFGTWWHITRGTLLAAAAVIVLTAINMRSVKMAAWLQNTAALSYLAAIVGIVALGFLFGHGSRSHFFTPLHDGVPAVTLNGVGIAMIALFWTYDGWEYLSWAGGEIKNPRRNLPLAMVSGILLVLVTYLLANAVFLYALPPEQLAAETSLVDSALTALFSRNVGVWVSLFIALISFGAASVAILGGARIYYSMARDGLFFSVMRRIHPRWNTPVASLIAQAVWVVLLIASGRYDQLYTCFIFVMTFSYILTVGAVLILRRTQPERPRPYRCVVYPWLPITYIVIAFLFLASTLRTRPRESLTGLGLLLLGLPLYRFWKRVSLRESERLTGNLPGH